MEAGGILFGKTVPGPEWERRAFTSRRISLALGFTHSGGSRFIYTDLPLYCAGKSHPEYQMVFLESRNSFCFYLPTKCFLACPICFWRQLPCSPDRSPMACCLSSLLKQVSLHLIESFVFSMSCQFPRISLFTLIWRSLQTPGGSSRSHPGLRIPYFSFQILSNILRAAVTGHIVKY